MINLKLHKTNDTIRCTAIYFSAIQQLSYKIKLQLLVKIKILPSFIRFYLTSAYEFCRFQPYTAYASKARS